MKRFLSLLWAIFLLVFSLGFSCLARAEKIYVVNPYAPTPPVKVHSLAPRFDTLKGKTIYVVDVKYPSTQNFRDELMGLLKGMYPETNWIFKEKKGTYFEDDPALWKEIKAKGAGMVLFVGH